MSVNITGPALSSLLFEHCNSDGDREGFLLGSVTNVITNTISDADINVVKHQIIYNIYSFVPVYGLSRWYNRNGEVDESVLLEILQGVNIKEVVGWYKLRRNSSMQISVKEHAVHRHLSRWLQRDNDSDAVLFMLCVSQSATDPALYTCDHQYMKTTATGDYECLPETVISLVGVAEPNYKSSAVCISSQQCTYNRVLKKSRRAFVDENNEPVVVCEISSLGERLRQKLKTLSGSVLDTEEQIAKELTEVRLLRQQLEECRDRTVDAPDTMAASDALVSVEETPLMMVCDDETNLPGASEPILCDSDGSEDISFTRQLPDNSRDSQEREQELSMLLDSGDEASSHQAPCLIPDSFALSGSSASGNLADGHTQVRSASPITHHADVPNGSIQKPAESQPFNFVQDMMRSCSPNQSSKSPVLTRHRSGAATRGNELIAAEFNRLKSQGGSHPEGMTGQTADNNDSK